MPDINNKTLTERQQLDLIGKLVNTIWEDKKTLQNLADMSLDQRSAVTFQQIKQPTEHILGVLDNIREERFTPEIGGGTGKEINPSWHIHNGRGVGRGHDGDPVGGGCGDDR